MKGNYTPPYIGPHFLRVRERVIMTIVARKHPYPLTIDEVFYDEMNIEGWTKTEVDYAIESLCEQKRVFLSEERLPAIQVLLTAEELERNYEQLRRSKR